MSKRISITLSDRIWEELEEWAATEGRNTASLAGSIVEIAVVQHRQEIDLPISLSRSLQRWAEVRGIRTTDLIVELLSSALEQAQERGNFSA